MFSVDVDVSDIYYSVVVLLLIPPKLTVSRGELRLAGVTPGIKPVATS